MADPTAAPVIAAPPAPPETEIQKIEIAIENVVHTVVVKVEAGWQWVDGEFVYLENEAKAAYAWVQKEDPQLAAYLHQLFLNWEADAAKAATMAAGAMGSVISNSSDTIGTAVDNFVGELLGTLGAGGSAPTAKAAVALLVSQGEGALLSIVKGSLAKAVGALLPAV